MTAPGGHRNLAAPGVGESARPLFDECPAAGRLLVQADAIFPVAGAHPRRLADPADEAPHDPGVQERKVRHDLPARRGLAPDRFDLRRDRLSVRQQVGGDVFGLDPAFAIARAMHEADAARRHQAEEQLLFLDAVILPDQRLEQGPIEAASKLAELAITLLPVEDGIDRLHAQPWSSTMASSNNPG